MDEFPGTNSFALEYKRDIPEQLTDEHMDYIFMNSMLSNYAKEGRNPDGTKNGNFYLDRDSGRRASQEVVQTYLKLTGKANEDNLVHSLTKPGSQIPVAPSRSLIWRDQLAKSMFSRPIRITIR